MTGSRGHVKASHSISGVFVFLLLGIFALFGTAMVLLGVHAYRQTAARSGVHNSFRIVSSYLRTMVRGDDETGAVRVEEADGLQTVSLLNVYDGEEYVTRLYVFDGFLRESISEMSEPFAPERGEKVCAAEEMQASLSDGLLEIQVLSEGIWDEVVIALKAAGGGNERLLP